QAGIARGRLPHPTPAPPKSRWFSARRRGKGYLPRRKVAQVYFPLAALHLPALRLPLGLHWRFPPLSAARGLPRRIGGDLGRLTSNYVRAERRGRRESPLRQHALRLRSNTALRQNTWKTVLNCSQSEANSTQVARSQLSSVSLWLNLRKQLCFLL